jgi:hypothetical protein
VAQSQPIRNRFVAKCSNRTTVNLWPVQNGTRFATRGVRECNKKKNRTALKEAEAASDAFAELYGAKYDKAVECLTKDRDVLLTFYDFPAEHWKHLRTTRSRAPSQPSDIERQGRKDASRTRRRLP